MEHWVFERSQISGDSEVRVAFIRVNLVHLECENHAGSVIHAWIG